MAKVIIGVVLVMIGLIVWSQVGGDTATVPDSPTDNPLDGVGDAAKGAPDAAADAVAKLPTPFWEKAVPVVICCIAAWFIVTKLPKSFWILLLVIVALGAYAAQR